MSYLGLFLYPFTLLVTILHEMGHALGALLTGGAVVSLKVAPDGSGLCTTAGGLAFVVIPVGYLGSVVFGNLMLYLGIKRPKLARSALFAFALALIGISFVWFGGITSLAITLGWGLVFLLIAYKLPKVSRLFFILAGVYSVVYVLRDYSGGPSSDLAVFASLTHLPATLWTYVWLGLAVLITFCNVFFFLRGKQK
jgi:hypothetical protein